ALPGLYSSMRIDTALHGQHLLIQRLGAIDATDDVLKDSAARLKESLVEMDGMTQLYEATVDEPADRALFAEFTQVRAKYDHALTNLLNLDRSQGNVAAQGLLAAQVLPAWGGLE